MLVRDLLRLFDDRYISSNLKPSTQAGYRVNINNHILPFFIDMDTSGVDFTVLDNFIAYLYDKKLSGTSCKYAYAVLRKAFNWGFRRGLIERHILGDYDPPRSQRFYHSILNEFQLRKLLQVSKSNDIYPAIVLACHYGCRRGEILGLKWSDFSNISFCISRNLVYIKGIQQITTPKSGKQREILLLPLDYEILKSWHFSRPFNKDGFLLRNVNGEVISGAMLEKHFKKILTAAELPDVRFHDLRHSYATSMLRNGVNPKIVSEVLGHSSVKVTLDIYSHCDIHMQQCCLDALKF